MDIDLNTLDTLRIDELRALWDEHMGRSKPPRQRRLLIRELAWRMQEQLHGGLDAETRKLLQSAMRMAAAIPNPGDSDDETGMPLRKRRRKRAVTPHLSDAARLVRDWHGRRHEVLVIDDGKQFRYHDRTYRSLSEIAREITGARWSGPRFFGLTTRQLADNEQPRVSITHRRPRNGDQTS